MKKFIFLTFGFMGWAFYEMSGGADFDPEAQRLARAEAAETTDTTNLVTAALANAARQLDQRDTVYPARKAVATAPQEKRPEATRVALNLTTLSDLPRPGDMAMVQKAVAKAPEQKPTPAVIKAGAPAANSTGAKVIKAAATTDDIPRTAGSTVSSTNTPAIIPSMIDTGATNVAQIDASQTGTTRISTSSADIRVVNGTRVNVRGGPGTNFGVVGKLGMGDTVQVIEDNGAGWVRFRTVNGEESGWMADFLLSNG